MKFLSEYQNTFEHYLQNKIKAQDPHNLYDPILYILSDQGKRIRPVMTLLSCEMFSQEINTALPAALAVEVFHNFTLVHDDIMDDAELRRGKKSVHAKYGVNTAILSGDAMMLMAYRFLLEVNDRKIKQSLTEVLTETGILLCEGQQLDVDFETRDNVTIDNYLEMIEKKTSVLLGAALKMGAIIGGATDIDHDHLFAFGKYIGIAFQIQDDILDVYGEGKKVGKTTGGDIINNKKTYLYLKALEMADVHQKKQLLDFYSSSPDDPRDKISAVKSIFKGLVVEEYARQLKDAYLDLGKSHLKALNLPNDKKSKLNQLADFLVSRES